MAVHPGASKARKVLEAAGHTRRVEAIEKGLAALGYNQRVGAVNPALQSRPVKGGTEIGDGGEVHVESEKAHDAAHLTRKRPDPPGIASHPLRRRKAVP